MFQTFTKLNKTISELEELINSNDDVKEALKNNLIPNYQIRNDETFEKIFNFQNLIGSSTYLSYATFENHVKMTDALISLRKHPDLFSSNLMYSTFLNSFIANINTNVIEEIDRAILEENKIERANEEIEHGQVSLKRPAFFNLAFKINLVLNTTEVEIEKGKLDEEENIETMDINFDDLEQPDSEAQ